MSCGGCQGTAEMPQAWETCLDYALGDIVAGWTQKERGVEIPSAAMGRVGGPADRTPPLHKADCGGYLNHIVWGDDLILVAIDLAILIDLVK